MKECVLVASSVRGQALRPSPWDAPPCGAERRLLALTFRLLSIRKGEQGDPTQLPENTSASSYLMGKNVPTQEDSNKP